MFSELGVLWIDHMAVTTGDFDETVKHFLSLPNARIVRGPGWNSSQKVHYMFISFGGEMCVEILGLPEDESSPIRVHVQAGGGAYHLCYAVNNLDAAIANAKQLGSRIVVEPKEDDAYQGRKVAFLIHPAHGLFELVEAYGHFKDNKASMLSMLASDHTDSSGQIFVSLDAAFKKVFSNSLPEDHADWSVENIRGWDSLSHLRLAMEVERTLDINIPSHMLSHLQSFDAFLAYISKKAEPLA